MCLILRHTLFTSQDGNVFNTAPYTVHVAALRTVETVYVSQVFRYFRCFPSKEHYVLLEKSSCIQQVPYIIFYLNLVSGQLIVESGVCGLQWHMGTFCASMMKQIHIPLFTLTCRCRPLVCSFTEWLHFSITFVKAYNRNF
jgi:hypothetical protein